MNEWDYLNLDGTIFGDLRLRLAEESDFPTIRDMWLHPTTLKEIRESREFAEQTLNKLWELDPATLEISEIRHFVVEIVKSRDVIAYLRLLYPFLEPQCLWMSFFVVAPELRGQGHGRNIMRL